MSVKKRDPQPGEARTGHQYDIAYGQYRAEKSNNIVRKELLRQVKGKPSRSLATESVFRSGWIGVARAVRLVVAILLVAGFFVGGVGGGILVGYITTAKPVSLEAIYQSDEIRNTVIYDADGNVMIKLTGSDNIKRESFTYDDVKDTYIDDAFIAIEDERFEEHIGIDPKRIGSAILSALLNSGSASHGGSTITQQTVKMITGADETSAQRKIGEWAKAIDMETRFTKQEIMQLYLNLVPMANGYVGIQSASKAYFGKPASELNLAECALLAGVPKSPSYFNPLTESGLRNALRRQRIVLGKMLELNKITQAQYDEALNTELVILPEEKQISSGRVYTYFEDYIIDVVIQDLAAKYGWSTSLAETVLYNSGLTIKTTMDPAIQQVMNETFKDESLFVHVPSVVADYPEHAQAGMVVIDQRTGQIKGMYGGYGEKTESRSFNRATETERQPGSSIKPIGVYGPAIDLGRITGASIIEDKILYYNPETPSKPYPENVEKQYSGPMTVRQAVIQSKNTIAMYTWKNILGGGSSLYYLNRLGINRLTENYVSIALGGFNQGMSPLEMAGAYTALANNGQYTPPYAYTEVLSAENGEVLLSHDAPEFTSVFKPETAFMMTDILVDTVESYRAIEANVPYEILNASGQKILAAAKSGTSDENVDRWLVGYTPYYTGAVWYGYDNKLRTTTVPGTDHYSPPDIWFSVMDRIHDNLAPKAFDKPATVKGIKVCKTTGLLPVEGQCTGVITEYFVEGSPLIPTLSCTKHAPSPTPSPTPMPTVPTTAATSAPTSAPTTVKPTGKPTTAPTTTPATTPSTAPTTSTTTATEPTSTTTVSGGG